MQNFDAGYGNINPSQMKFDRSVVITCLVNINKGCAFAGFSFGTHTMDFQGKRKNLATGWAVTSF